MPIYRSTVTIRLGRTGYPERRATETITERFNADSDEQADEHTITIMKYHLKKCRPGVDAFEVNVGKPCKD